MLSVKAYCDAYGYSRSTIADCIKQGRLEGATPAEGGGWAIPEDALPRYAPRKKSNWTMTDRMYDYLMALNRRFFVDEQALCCSKNELGDVEQTLLEAGLIRRSSTPADGKWHTGYSITEKGASYIANGKLGFRRLVKQLIGSGAVLGAVSTVAAAGLPVITAASVSLLS